MFYTSIIFPSCQLKCSGSKYGRIMHWLIHSFLIGLDTHPFNNHKRFFIFGGSTYVTYVTYRSSYKSPEIIQTSGDGTREMALWWRALTAGPEDPELFLTTILFYFQGIPSSGLYRHQASTQCMNLTCEQNAHTCLKNNNKKNKTKPSDANQLRNNH